VVNITGLSGQDESESVVKMDQNIQQLEKGLNMPTYISESGGFLTQYHSKKIFRILDEAKKNNCNSEFILEELVREGDTLVFAKNLFKMFVIAAYLLIGITLVYFILNIIQ
jgi:hypothetical protein